MRLRHNALALACAATLALSITMPDAAAASPSPAAAASPVAVPEQTTAEQKAVDAANADAEKRRDTIRYGIDAEILDLLRTLLSEKDGSFNDDLHELFGRTRNAKLRIALLDFFAELEWKGARERALAIVEGRDGLDAATVTSALNYLAAIRSSEALAFAEAIVKEDDKKILPALIRLLGRAGGKAEEELLLGWFESDAATVALKQEAIGALGEIGSTAAAGRLAALAGDAEATSATRMAACAALGKIKDPTTVPALVQAANGEDANVRARAVESLAAFEDEASAAALVEALRDPHVKSRIAACRGIASRRIAAADSFLRYKARNDPERAVKIEALKALAELGGDSFAFLKERMADAKAEIQFRALCFGLLMRKDGQSLEVLSATLATEAAEKERGVYTAYVKEIANASDAPGAAALARILLADKDHLMRVGAVEWARKNKALDFRPELERLSKDDPSEMIRKRAAEALAAIDREE